MFGSIIAVCGYDRAGHNRLMTDCGLCERWAARPGSLAYNRSVGAGASTDVEGTGLFLFRVFLLSFEPANDSICSSTELLV